MDNSGASRRSNRMNPQPSASSASGYAIYEGFDMEQSQQYNGQSYYTDYGNYDPNSAPQLFEDTSQYAPTFNYYQSQPQPSMYGVNQSNLLNPQMLMVGAQQLQPMATAMIEDYSKSVMDKGKSWIGQNIKYYFAVDTGYVLKKLLLIFFPFSHRDWSIRFSTDDAVAPRDDVNSPDLYIPSMAFVTYILVAGYLLGVQNHFSPEQLSITASSALAWLLLEVIIVIGALYLLSISCALGFFHMISYGGYKFVCIVAALLMSLPFKSIGYYAVLGYTSLSFGFFLMRSLHIAIQTVPKHGTQTKEPRNALYLVLIICLWQPLLMYVLSRHLVISPILN